MKPYVYALLFVMCLSAVIRTDSVVVAISASVSAAGFLVWTLRETK